MEKRNLWDMNRLVEYLGVPRSTVYEHIALGRIPFVQVGRHKRFIPDEVEKAIKKLPVPTPAKRRSA